MHGKFTRFKTLKRHAALVIGLIFIQGWFIDTSAQNINQQDAKDAAAEERTNELYEEFSLDEMNDVGYALQRLRQQAINIYIEATRKRGAPEVTSELPNLLRVPNKIPATQKGLVPFRRPWLVYFVANMEPLLHLLKEEVKEIENGTAAKDVEEKRRARLQPLLEKSRVAVKKIEEQVARITAMIEDAAQSNIAIATAAQEMDRQLEYLEHIRDEAFDIAYDCNHHKHLPAHRTKGS